MSRILARMTTVLSGLALLVAGLSGLNGLTGLNGLPPAHAAGRTPVIFLHGYGGAASDVEAIRPNLVANGYAASDIHSLDFPNTDSNETVAAKLKTKVDQVLASTGASKVDLIGFSMGSLSSRYYLKSLGGTAKVAHWVSIAGPNHGTAQASWCWLVTTDPGCGQMAPNSSFLTALNSGDETPGDTAYATWVSHCDDVINPPESTPLTGAQNTWTPNCLTHSGTLQDAGVARGIAEFFSGTTTPPPPPPVGNLALNKPATGTTSCNSLETPAKAVNGSVSGGNSDKFCSLTTNAWLKVDLGASKTLTSITIKHAQAGGEPASLNTRDFTLQVSLDNSTWRTVATVTGNTAGSTTHPVTGDARYVRLTVTKAVQDGAAHPGTRVYELEVYGS